MTTVQLAIHNERYAATLADLLRQDGSRRVSIVEKPNPKVEGVMVLDGNRPENLLIFEAQPERCVVIARKDASLLSKIWDAGVRHVVFEADTPATALLAVIAAELRLPHLASSNCLPAFAADDRRHFLPKFTIPILDLPANACRCSTRVCKKSF